MLAATRPLPLDLPLARPPDGFPRWLRTHRGAVAMAGLLAFAAPLTFFTGALSVMRALTTASVAGLGLWWLLYGASLWGLLLVAGYGCERMARRFPPPFRAAIWLVGAGSAAALANFATTGRTAILVEQGLVYSAQTAHLYAFTFSLIMALLYFAHLRRSRGHEQAAARLAAAQAAQRLARRRTVQGRLQEVQARIDPQLLFEMLETVQRLYQRDAAQAERFLDELIVFLRAALPRLRTASSSLLREVELARAFVRLHAMRGVVDLDIAIEIAPDVIHARFPPGVLLPLLDGVVGGARSCGLRAMRSGEYCRVALTLGAAPSLAAVARVRSLLAELYGTGGTVEIESTSDGVTVIVGVPHELA
jgi:Histidine kinase